MVEPRTLTLSGFPFLSLLMDDDLSFQVVRGKEAGQESGRLDRAARHPRRSLHHDRGNAPYGFLKVVREHCTKSPHIENVLYRITIFPHI